MSESSKTFSDVWYRVARQSVSLRPRVEVRRQTFRGQRWHVLYDPFNNQFFRLRPEGYAFVARLRPNRTVEEAWQETLDQDPDKAPGQEDVIQLLAQLYHANLLHYREAADSEHFFSRYRKRRQRERMFTLSNLMFSRFPLLDPNAALDRALPILNWIFRPWFMVLWSAAFGWAVKSCIDHGGELMASSAGILSTSNLMLLYLGIVIAKVLHEFGHAAACKRYGGEVHTMGVMMLFFSPLPYVDVTSSWSFRNRWERIIVASAGVITEIFVASFAAVAWANSGPGVWHDLAFNMMVTSGVTTVLFNANPLLRYDGYYVFSDLVEIPNLYQRAQQMLTYIAEYHLFGARNSKPPAETRREKAWLTVYGTTSLFYRAAIFTGIVWVMSGRFLIVGALVAVFCGIAWALVPAISFVRYLVSSPKLERSRTRAIIVTAGLGIAAILALFVIPAPQRLQSTGVVQARAFSDVAAGVDGRLDRFEVPSGQVVREGQLLARLTNDDIVHEAEMARAQLRELEAVWHVGLSDGSRTRVALEEGIAAVRSRVMDLEERMKQREVRAPIAGVWISPASDEFKGRWLTRGTPIGSILGPKGFTFVAVVPQTKSARLFAHDIASDRAKVRLKGQAGTGLDVSRLVMVPAEQTRLPSAALAQNNGGDIALSKEAGKEPIAAESFFEVRADLIPRVGVAVLQGVTGRITFDLPSEPLGIQWIRGVSQVFQKRAVN